MPRSRPVRTSFNAGEWSPRMQGRVDLDKYLHAGETCENLIIQAQGGFNRRPGTKYVAASKAQDYDPRLMPFEFGPNQSFVIELGDTYGRFYTLGGQVIVSATDASITNGDFSAGLTGWTDTSSGASSIAVAANDVLVQAATGTVIGNMTGSISGGIASGTGYRYHRVKLEGGAADNGFTIAHVAFYTGARVLVADAAGTAIGNLTANGAISNVSAFIGAPFRPALICPQSAGSPAYVGKDWGAGVTKTITGLTVIGSNDKGLKLEADPIVTLTLQGSTDNFVSSTVQLATMQILPQSGVYTFNLFDDDTSGAWLDCLHSVGDVAYLGKHWSGTKTITGFVIRGSTDHGFKKGENPKVTATLQGSTDNFVTSVVDLASVIVTDKTGPVAASIRKRVATGTAYAYHRVKLRGGNRNVPFAVSQLQFYESGSSTGKLRLVVGATGQAAADQSFTVGASYRDVPHTLRFRVTADHGVRCSVRIGHATDLFDILPYTLVGDGLHTLSFIPNTSPCVLQFRSYDTQEVQIDDVAILVDQPYEVKTPYVKGDLPDLKWDQAGDVAWIAHATHPLRNLIRKGNTNWLMQTVDLIDGPYLDINIDDNNMITASAASGTGVTLTASNALFQPGHVGSCWRLCATGGVPGCSTWKIGEAVTAGDHRKFGDNVYKAATSATTGNSPPIHDRGTVSDGAVDWLFRNRAGWGYVIITGYTSATVVTCTVKKLLDTSVTSGTAVWREGAFSAYRGYAEVVALTGDRLFLGRGLEFYLSGVGLYDDYSPDGDDDSAIYGKIAESIGAPIQWATGHERIVVGTARGPWIIRAGNDDPALTPKNITVRQQNASGSADIDAVKAESGILYLSRSARRLYELSPAIDQNGNVGYKAVDLTVLADHVLGTGALGLAVAKEPQTLIWAWREGGQVATLTYNAPEQIVAWSRQIMGGQMSALAVIPGANDDQQRDEVWMCVRRTIAGQDVRYIEYLQADVAFDGEAADAWYADCASSYTGEQVVTLVPGEGADAPGAEVIFDAGAAVWSDDDVGRFIRAGRHGGLAEIVGVDSPTSIEAEIIHPWMPLSTILAGQWQMSAQTLTGLGYLEAETLRVTTDGGEHGDVTVANGTVTLDYQAFEIVAGLPIAYRYKSLKIPEGGVSGPSIGAKKRVSKLQIGVVASGECEVGFDDKLPLQPAFDQPVASIGRVPDLVTGELKVSLASSYEDDPRLVIAGNGGRPLNVTHVVFDDLSTNEMA